MVIIEGVNQYFSAQHIVYFDKRHQVPEYGGPLQWFVFVDTTGTNNYLIPCKTEDAANQVIEQLKLAVKSVR